VKYRTIVADPPWPMRYDGLGWRDGGAFKKTRSFTGKRGLGYSTMSVDDICALDVAALADHDCHLYLWIPDSLLIQGVAAQVITAWGFKPGRILIWHKRNFGLGTFPRPQHEAIVCAKRGKPQYRVTNQGSVHNLPLHYDPRVGKRHSEKPEAMLDLIERASHPPYLELFARRQRLGWDTWGDEALCHVDLTVEQR
jgi:N6-adenosine-specific RNA methylase IME4